MKKTFVIAAAGSMLLFVLIVFAFAGIGSGGAGSAGSPLMAFATEDEAYAYQFIGSELGVPWDIIMLADGMHAYQNGINTLKDYNPILTSLEFCILIEECQIPASASGGDAGVSSGDAEDPWVTQSISYYSGKKEILAYIGKSESGLTFKDSTGIVNAINELAEEKSTEDLRYVATLTVNEDIEGVLRDLIGLNEETISYAMSVYDTTYLVSLYGYTASVPDVALPEIVVGDVTRGDLAKVAISLINWPYLMGGKSAQEGVPKGALDCSGYVDWVYYQCFGTVVSGGATPEGIPVSGTAQQWYACEEISEDELQVGDLGFVRDPSTLRKGQINHVGIYIGSDADGNKYFIHCGGSKFKTDFAPRGRVGISVKLGKNNYNPVDGTTFSPDMNACVFKYFRRPRFAFK